MLLQTKNYREYCQFKDGACNTLSVLSVNIGLNENKEMMLKHSLVSLLFLIAFGTSPIEADCQSPTMPTIPAYGYADGVNNISIFSDFDSLTLKCNPGYKGTPTSSQLFCYNGTWLGNPIVCSIVDCGSPLAIISGHVMLDSPNNTTYNSTATITCNTGYALNGASSITCQSNGIWSDGGNCKQLDCGDPIPPTNGSITEKTGTLFGDFATVECDGGFNSDVTSSNSISCSADGNWTPNISCIIVDCGSPPIPVGGSVTLDTGKTVYQSSATQTCNYGHTAGNGTTGTIVCQSSGDWETGITCEPKDCGKPPSPVNGSVQLRSSNTLILSHATQSCLTGYKAVGVSADLFCLDYGWSTDLTGIKCEIVDCGTPILIANGEIELDGMSTTTYGATANVTCKSGYKLPENSTESIECLPTGLWSSHATCERIDCGSPPELMNGSVSLDPPGSTKFESTATQNCDDGFTAINATTNTIICLATGNWGEGITCV